MSLINKMLQDLDARGTAAGEVYPMPARPVVREERTLPLRAIAVAAGIAVAGAAGWFAWQQHAAAPAPVAPAARPVPAAVSAPAVVSPASAPAAVVQPAPEPVAAASRHDDMKPSPAHAATEIPAPAAAAVAVPRSKSFEPMEPDSAEAREARRVMMALLAARQGAPAPMPKAVARAAAAVRPVPAKERHVAAPQDVQAGAPRRAEAAYRRALDRLQDGRIGETVAALEEALRIDPRHDAARQTLVGLLIEDGRPDEAIHQLELGLAQDPRQPALAMLLARLQIERGAGGIETLMRTLPYAGNDPDYHAFLGGALERQQRHREAAEQYLVAVRGAPANGVWWMGLGIALQGDKRNAEALDAFRKARASGALNAELAAFVDRRIQQLDR